MRLFPGHKEGAIMPMYTSRFSNPELRSGRYTAVRISVGAPRFNTGYRLDGEIKDLMPYGLFGKYDDDIKVFRSEYIKRLDSIGVDRIHRQLQAFSGDVVLLCWEDVRKGHDDWCHRTMFAEWWLERTGEAIFELPDPSAVKRPKPRKAAKSQKDKPEDSSAEGQQPPAFEQLSIY